MAGTRTIVRKATRALTSRAPRRRVARAAYLAGAILLVAGATGSAYFYLFLLDLVAHYLPDVVLPALSVLAYALVVLAGLGGLTVILGGYLIERGKRLLGAFLVGIGAGSSLIGFLIQLGLVALQGGSPIQAAQGALTGVTAIALLLCFWVQLKA